MDLVVELGRHQSDVQVRLALQNGQVEAADSQPPTHHSEMLLLDRSAITACLVTSILVTKLLCNIDCASARDTSGQAMTSYDFLEHRH